jgi:hypothetical protein
VDVFDCADIKARVGWMATSSSGFLSIPGRNRFLLIAAGHAADNGFGTLTAPTSYWLISNQHIAGWHRIG